MIVWPDPATTRVFICDTNYVHFTLFSIYVVYASITPALFPSSSFQGLDEFTRASALQNPKVPGPPVVSRLLLVASDFSVWALALGFRQFWPFVFSDVCTALVLYHLGDDPRSYANEKESDSLSMNSRFQGANDSAHQRPTEGAHMLMWSLRTRSRNAEVTPHDSPFTASDK